MLWILNIMYGGKQKMYKDEKIKEYLKSNRQLIISDIESFENDDGTLAVSNLYYMQHVNSLVDVSRQFLEHYIKRVCVCDARVSYKFNSSDVENIFYLYGMTIEINSKPMFLSLEKMSEYGLLYLLNKHCFHPVGLSLVRNQIKVEMYPPTYEDTGICNKFISDLDRVTQYSIESTDNNEIKLVKFQRFIKMFLRNSKKSK